MHGLHLVEPGDGMSWHNMNEAGEGNIATWSDVENAFLGEMESIVVIMSKYRCCMLQCTPLQILHRSMMPLTPSMIVTDR